MWFQILSCRNSAVGGVLSVFGQGQVLNRMVQGKPYLYILFERIALDLKPGVPLKNPPSIFWFFMIFVYINMLRMDNYSKRISYCYMLEQCAINFEIPLLPLFQRGRAFFPSLV
jgi:hypothetical protein